MRKSAILSIILLAAVFAFGEGTHTWEQSKFEQFEKGTAKGVAIRSDGTLEMAPTFKAIYTTPSTYLWSVATDAAGNVYAAAGSPARVYRITPDGQASIIFEPQELQVQALISDKSGAIYAATSPDGKVYRIERTRKKEAAKTEPVAKPADKGNVPLDSAFAARVFFDPKTKYIWDLALDKEGRLYVATGDKGEIFRVQSDGESALFFKSDEAHIRVLAFDPEGRLICGSDGSGLVYRISKDGEAFVLYSAPKKEITALAVDRAGNIYAAAVGEKRSQAPVSPPAAITTPIIAAPQPGTGAPVPPAPMLMLGAIPFPALGASGGSEVYRIEPDGSPRRIWNSREDLVYALAFDQNGRLLAGTGNKGRVFAISDDGQFTDLLKASATQVTAFAQAPAGGLYAASSNLGKIFRLGGEPSGEASYESDVYDARNFSRWGRAQVRGTGSFEIYARSGNVDNPDRNWSPWKLVNLQADVPIEVPAARFVQWKAVLKASNPAPTIESVLLNYLPKNVPPALEEVIVQAGARFQQQPKPAENMITVGGNPPPQPKFDAPTPAMRDRDSIAVRWTAHDDNDDQLVYSLYYRGDGETRWKLLKDKLTDRLYSFDAGLLPDGGYVMKVVASDAPSHSPDESLSAEKESARFEVDTTPPRIDDLNAALDDAGVHVTFRATDSFSALKRAEYSVDAGDWHFVEPVGGLSDARVENYDFTVRSPGSNPAGAESRPRRGDGGSPEHTVVVRVYDRFDNMSAAKTVIRGK